MKKVYITEDSISRLKTNDTLPSFLYKMVKGHMTSLGDNQAFPMGEDYPFDYVILKRRYKQVREAMAEIGLQDASEDELMTELSRLVRRCKELEKPISNALEDLCVNAVNRLFAIPKDSIILECKLVDKVKFNDSPRVMPEGMDETTYTFNDIADMEDSSHAVAKRRLTNSLIQGGAYTYSRMESLYEDDLNKMNQDLLPLYDKIIRINDYLLFTKKEEMSDEKPMQGSYVSTSLGSDGKKSSIKAQGVIFPLLLQETIRGLLELFASHGLPLDRAKAKYIIGKADFMLAEPWDMRFGVGLWNIMFGDITDTNIIPYLFTRIVSLSVDEFNTACKEIFAKTRKGEGIMKDIITDATYDSDYQEFTNRINAKNQDKSLIADSYFTASELDGLELDGDDGDAELLDEDNPYDSFRNDQAFRYRAIGELARQGYLFHGTEGDAWDKADASRIHGGTRAVYGYGVYFTNEAYKCEEYGNNFVILDANGFNFLDLGFTVDEKDNPFSNWRDTKDDCEQRLYQLDSMLNDAESNAEYNEIEGEIERLQAKADKLANPQYERMYAIYSNAISKGSTYKNLNAVLKDYNVDDKAISEMYLRQGYDGFQYGNQFVVFNFDKLNDSIVKDKDGLIASTLAN